MLLLDALLLLHVVQLLLVARSDLLRRRARLDQVLAAHQILLVALLGHQLQVLVAEDLALPLPDLLLLVLHLLCAKVVHLDHLRVSQLVRPPVGCLLLILLTDELLRCIAEHTLLLPMVIELILVLNAFLGYLTQHVVSFAHAVPPFELLLLLLELYRLLKLVAVVLRVDQFLHLFVRLLALVCLGLACDDGAPFVEVALGVPWVVALVVLD